jgi:hypothetical protein
MRRSSFLHQTNCGIAGTFHFVGPATALRQSNFKGKPQQDQYPSEGSRKPLTTLLYPVLIPKCKKVQSPGNMKYPHTPDRSPPHSSRRHRISQNTVQANGWEPRAKHCHGDGISGCGEMMRIKSDHILPHQRTFSLQSPPHAFYCCTNAKSAAM